MSPADRATLPDMPVENVEDGVAPPWRCHACVKNDKYAVQRVVDVMRAENGQFYLLIEYLGYRYLEARPESWLEDKKGELRLAYKAHVTVRLHKGMLFFGKHIYRSRPHNETRPSHPEMPNRLDLQACYTAGGLSSRPCDQASP